MRIFQTILPYSHREKRKMIGFTLEVSQFKELKRCAQLCNMTISEMTAFIVEQYLNGNIEVNCRVFTERIDELLNKKEAFIRDCETKRQRYHDNKQLSLLDLRAEKW